MTSTRVPNPQSSTGVLSSDCDSSSRLHALRGLIDSLVWSSGTQVDCIRISRAWTGRNRRLTVEYVIGLLTDGALVEYPVQGVIADSTPRGTNLGNGPQLNTGVPMGIFQVNRSASCWITSPDRDPELPTARTLLVPGGMERALKQAQSKGYIPPLVNMAELSIDSIQWISYRAGRRFVLKLESRNESSGGIFVKGFRRPPGQFGVGKAREMAETLFVRSKGQVRVPSILGIIPELNLQVFSEVWPKPSQLNYNSFAITSAARVAALIHTLPIGHERIHSAADELNTVERWMPALDVFRPDREFPLRHIVTRLSERQPWFSKDTAAVIHRDFYHSQLLRNNDAIWLTDWDTQSIGHAELDIATYVAHAHLDGLLAGSQTCGWGIPIREFLTGYRASGGSFDPERLGWYLACALTRLAAMFSARQVPDSTMEPLWRLAERFAESPHTSLDGWEG